MRWYHLWERPVLLEGFRGQLGVQLGAGLCSARRRVPADFLPVIFKHDDVELELTDGDDEHFLVVDGCI